MTTVLGKLKVLDGDDVRDGRQGLVIERIDDVRFDVGDVLQDVDGHRQWKVMSFGFASWGNPEHIRTRAVITVRPCGHSAPVGAGTFDVIAAEHAAALPE